MTPIRQRMIEDMRLRNFSRHTQDAYVRAVAHFAEEKDTIVTGVTFTELRAEHAEE